MALLLPFYISVRLYCSQRTSTIVARVFGALQVILQQGSEGTGNGKVSLNEEPGKRQVWRNNS